MQDTQTTKPLYDPNFVKNLFDNMSSSYERMNYLTSFGFSLRWRKQFLQTIAASKEQIAVIDLLSGMGETWVPVKKRFPAAQCTAIDFSDGMVRYALEKNEKRQLGFNMIKQDMLDNELPSNHFDVAVSAFGLKTFSDPQIHILAKEIKRILKPGGQFSFIEISEPPNRILYFFYRLYLKYIIPLLGKILLGNPDEYRMLWTYTHAYKNSQQAFEIFKAEGLEVNYASYFGGCASGIYGQNPVN